MKVLQLGPMPPPIGGATVLYQKLNEYVSTCTDIELLTIDTTFRGRNSISRMLFSLILIYNILVKIRHADVVFFHASLRGAYQFGPVVNLICKLFKKPWGFRGFGGNYYDWYLAQSSIKRMFLRYGILSADVVLFETRQLIDNFSYIFNLNYLWYPNSRYLQPAIQSKSQCNKFIFIGHVKPEKGVCDLLSIAKSLPDGVVIHVYGPLQGGLTAEHFDTDAVVYKGMLAPDQVVDTMGLYDALVFPTFYEGEGYPGVILEAYASGLPVISTKWKMIPELVDESSGTLIEPRDTSALLDAIVKFTSDAAFYKSLLSGVTDKANLYDMKRWNEYYIDICFQLGKKSRA